MRFFKKAAEFRRITCEKGRDAGSDLRVWSVGLRSGVWRRARGWEFWGGGGVDFGADGECEYEYEYEYEYECEYECEGDGCCWDRR